MNSVLYLPAPKQLPPHPTPSATRSEIPIKKAVHPAYITRFNEQQSSSSRNSKRFVPRSIAQFGDGGAFPEIHVIQYPRNLANPNRKKANTAALGGKGNSSQAVRSTSTAMVTIGADGKTVDYSSIVKRGTNSDKVVYANLDAMRKLVSCPADDPVPILHSPPKKLTQEDQAAWQIPPCVSNWKNTKGYTIPLDKRLAADGRGLQEASINNNFATLSESLYVAERQAREEVRLRGKISQKQMAGEKERREEGLRELAARARMDRGGGGGSSSGGKNENEVVNDNGKRFRDEDENDVGEKKEELYGGDGDNTNDDDTPPSRPRSDSNGQSESSVAAAQRDKLRAQRKKEREREMRLENLKGNAKKARLEDDRDVSEKIALGVHTGAGAAGGQLDSRLYNQSEGLDSGFGKEDEYNTYTKPLFDRDQAAKSVYRPTRGENDIGDADEQIRELQEGAGKRFKPDVGFAGTDTGGRSQQRDAPVQFEYGLSKNKGDEKGEENK
ncbi:hypothetical protein ScalyP_jg829 [Parmales sp. scaly parma]|nr:hypothetical protein ScalyP_jg829 [Parmales sp. scaly parma]